MDGKFFAFQMRQAKAPGKKVHLTCESCGAHEVRPKINLYTGHMYDCKCTYICVTCRGTMVVTNE